MRTTQQLSITLPNEMADVVKAKVRSKSACDAFPLPGSRGGDPAVAAAAGTLHPVVSSSMAGIPAPFS
jgi:hypothetical protein